MEIKSNQGENFIVAYLDIMGYRDLIKTTEPEKIKEAIEGTLKSPESISGDAADLAKSIELQLLSDSIILALNLDSLEQYQIGFKINQFLAICAALYVLLFCQLKKPIRGAVAIGQYYMEQLQTRFANHFLFSKALVEAYELENKHADVPRILLTQKLGALFTGEPHSKNKIKKDFDGLWIIDPYEFVRFCDGVNKSRDVENLYIKNLKEVLNSDIELKVKRKYEYMRMCHNQKMMANGLNEFLI